MFRDGTVFRYRVPHTRSWFDGCQVGFYLRDGMEYVEASMRRGLDVDDFAPRLSFFFNAHNEFFEEICKIRAARRIWATAMRERFGAKSERSWWMRTHVQTAGCSLTEQQPLNNIVRVAYQAMAGVLGGCQSLHTDSMDETLGLPTETAVRVALRTQQILAHETGVHRTVDPLGGSHVEALTDRMKRMPPRSSTKSTTWCGFWNQQGVFPPSHRRCFVSIWPRDGRGRPNCCGHECVPRRKRRPTSGDFANPHQVEVDQCDRLDAFKKKRDHDLVQKQLDVLRADARNGANTMPALVEASDAGATMGEMASVGGRLWPLFRWTGMVNHQLF